MLRGIGGAGGDLNVVRAKGASANAFVLGGNRAKIDLGASDSWFYPKESFWERTPSTDVMAKGTWDWIKAETGATQAGGMAMGYDNRREVKFEAYRMGRDVVLRKHDEYYGSSTSGESSTFYVIPRHDAAEEYHVIRKVVVRDPTVATRDPEAPENYYYYYHGEREGRRRPVVTVETYVVKNDRDRDEPTLIMTRTHDTTLGYPTEDVQWDNLKQLLPEKEHPALNEYRQYFEVDSRLLSSDYMSLMEMRAQVLKTRSTMTWQHENLLRKVGATDRAMGTIDTANSLISGATAGLAALGAAAIPIHMGVGAMLASEMVIRSTEKTIDGESLEAISVPLSAPNRV